MSKLPLKGSGPLLVTALSLLLVSSAMTAQTGPARAAEQRFMTIGTAGVTGIYYSVGGAICRLVNRERKRHGLRCSVESTGGSVYNLRNIRIGELDLGVVQSDWQYHAYNGTSLFEKDGADKNLRALFSLHPDTVSIVARKDAEIATLDDLKGKRVNLGNPGSGTLATAEAMLEALGWTKDDFALVAELKSAEQSQALCDDKIDAFYMVAGNPVGNILEAATTCDVVFVPAVSPEIDKMVASKPYYRHASVPGGIYRGADEDVPTYGVAATFVTSSEVPDDVVYEFVRAVFENFDDFKALHPALAHLTKEDMITQALSAPMHPGAIKYYKEVGLL